MARSDKKEEKTLGLRARTHGQKGTQICDLCANKCPEGHDSVFKNLGNLFEQGTFI